MGRSLYDSLNDETRALYPEGTRLFSPHYGRGTILFWTYDNETFTVRWDRARATSKHEDRYFAADLEGRNGLGRLRNGLGRLRKLTILEQLSEVE